MEYPKKVVRRLTRTVLPDGSETIKVDFLFEQTEVRRVEQSASKLAKERQQRRLLLTAFTDMSAIGRRRVEDEDDGLPSSMTLNVSKMKKLASQQNADTLVLKKGKGRGGRDQDGDAVYINKPSKRMAGTAPNALLQARLPRVCLAARLEKELMSLWKSKNAHFFWHPVDSNVLPTYYSRITNPVSLSDMRDKVSQLEYSTAQQLLEDMRLMADNAELFNGKANVVSVTAKRMLDQLTSSLAHDRTHFGSEKDSIALLEQAIQRKHHMLSIARQGPSQSQSSAL